MPKEDTESPSPKVFKTDSMWLNWTSPEHPGLKRTTLTKGLDYLTSRGPQTKLLYDSARANDLNKTRKKPLWIRDTDLSFDFFFIFIFIFLQVSTVILNISLYYYIKHSFIQM